MTRPRLDIVFEAERAGERDALAFTAGTLRLRDCELGTFATRSRWTARVLRRGMLRLRIPPRAVAWARVLLPSSRRSAFDRVVQLHAYWTGASRIMTTEQIRALAHGPVVLMYHAIARPGEAASCYVVPRRRFQRQMAWLKWSGARVVPLEQLISDLRSNRIPPRRSVAITFDDGYVDNLEAIPILRACRFPATVFVVSDALGQRAWWTTEPALAGRPIVDQGQVVALRHGGIAIGAHTRTHPSLTEIRHDHVPGEIRGSRTVLAQLTGDPIAAFAYPFGDYSPAVAAHVQAAGFDGAFCSRSGVVDPATPLFLLPRVEVRGTDSLARFALLVWRGHRHDTGPRTRTLQEATT
jgi:peptidoglycan/xylan/chitin deacetylase (PgdA/CDA1 family)